ncbi:MAG: Gfo/Idh/MocA family oxidoreductase [Boseongicola sp.]|nr:Gfo/Idh/MocA family oxidoreductase [Boseongicola sp.]MDD9976959.1 Gfo/Idh/MocA family oxidoreductase [Boseongicola sp.]
MKAALIGHGMVSQAHIAALDDSKLVELHGILGRSPENAKSWAQERDVSAQIYSDISELTNDTDLDFAILITPPDSRLEYVNALVEARVPILMEKPIERTHEAAQNIVEACEAAGVLNGVVFQHRARAAAMELKRLISAGDLGEALTVELRVPWWRDQSYYDAPGRGTYARDGGGVMINQAIHTLDLAIWLCGPVNAVQSIMHTTSLHQLEAEDWAGGLLHFKCGAVGTIMATTAAFPGAAESISIQFEKAHAHLEAGTLRLDHWDGSQEQIGESAATGGGADPMAFTHDWHQTVIEDFAKALAHQTPPLCSGRDALSAHAVIAAMEIAGKTEQRTTIEM